MSSITIYTVLEGHNSSAEGPEVRGVYTSHEEAVMDVVYQADWGLKGEEHEECWDDNRHIFTDETDDFYWYIDPWDIEVEG